MKILFVIHNKSVFNTGHLEDILSVDDKPKISSILVDKNEGSWAKRLLKKRSSGESGWMNISPAITVYSKQFIMTKSTEIVDTPTGVHSAVYEVLRDPLSFFIISRYYPGLSHNAYVFSQDLFFFCSNCYRILNDSGACKIIYQEVPHDAPSWIFAKTAIAMGKEVLFLTSTPLPSKYSIHKLDNSGRSNSGNFSHSTDNQLIRLCSQAVEKNQGIYTDAEPWYMKKTSKQDTGDMWSWKREAAQLLQNPRRGVLYDLWVVSKKKKIHKEFRFYSSKNIPQRYAVFFLHNQPERSSCPEAGIYAQQLLAIAALAKYLPAGCNLVVKEHPSVFRKKLHPYVRNDHFYRSICDGFGATLASNTLDAFSLVDRAVFVSTLTGAIGFQAICRGVPVVTFGNANYNFLSGVFPVVTMGENKAIESACRSSKISSSVLFQELLEEATGWYGPNASGDVAEDLAVALDEMLSDLGATSS